jgi:hypothetical protein
MLLSVAEHADGLGPHLSWFLPTLATLLAQGWSRCRVGDCSSLHMAAIVHRKMPPPSFVSCITVRNPMCDCRRREHNKKMRADPPARTSS